MKNILLTLIAFVPLIASANGVGNGGDVTSPAHPDTDMIKLAAAQSKLLISTFMNEEEWRFKLLNTGMTTTWATLSPKLFNVPKDIFKVIEETSLEVRDNGPCFDSLGAEMAGSIYSQFPNAICISSKLLSEKLDLYNYEYETAALVLHELSHLLGSTEQEAVSLQTAFIVNMRTTTYSKLRFIIQEQFARGLFGFEVDLSEISSAMGHYPDLKLPTCDFNPRVNWKLGAWGRSLKAQGNFAPLRAADMGLLKNQMIRLEMLADYICSEDSSQGGDYNKIRLDKGFENDLEINLQTYSIRLNENTLVGALPRDMTKRPQNSSDVYWALMKVRTTFSNIGQAAIKFSPYTGDTFFNLK